jgi:transposase
MRRKPAIPVFKRYVMNQVAMMPPSYEELIPVDHLVRVVNKVVEEINVSALLAQYKGSGSAFDPRADARLLAPLSTPAAHLCESTG